MARPTTSTTTTGGPAWAQIGLSPQISTHPRSLKYQFIYQGRYCSTNTIPSRPLWALPTWSTWTAPASTIFTKNPPSDLLWSSHGWAGWRTSMPVFPLLSSHIFHFWVLIFLSFELSCFFQEFASNLCAVWGQSKPNPQPLQIKIEKEKWLQQKCCNLQLLNDMKTTRNYV